MLTHTGIRCSAVKVTNDAVRRSLSAIGSKNVPNFVFCFELLAIKPSRPSDIPASRNMAKA